MIPGMSPAGATVSIVVPTFREVPNIEPLVRRTFEAVRQAGIPAEMILVDDDSRDGTVETVGWLSSEFPVRVEVRTDRRGLSSAVLRGFELARGDVFVVMDADLQHPPELIPDLAQPVIEGRADMAFGSRYTPGGRIAERWPWHRRLASRVATLLARPLVPLRDPMSGFFALDRETWRRAEKLRPTGFKIGLELAVKARCKHLTEIPFRFAARSSGHSKLRLAQQFEYLEQLVRLYWFRHRRVLAMALVISMGVISCAFMLRLTG